MAAAVHAWLHPESVLGSKLPDPILAAVPGFMALMLAELAVSIMRGKKVYNLRQTVSNLSAGVFLTLMVVFVKAMYIFPYAWLRSKLAIIPSAPEYTWLHNVIGVILVDHAYYWFHRTAHMSNLGWAAHVTHHSSNDYNFSTALRQGVGESMYSWLYYLYLAPFAPLEIFALHKGINTVIQFWVHTELIPKLWGPFEFVFNTPSHHRVHHARNYGRANFGGMLIIWDRLYGTFEAEAETRPCIYGLDNSRVPTGTHSPLWQQAHHLVATLRLAAADPSAAGSALFTRRYGPGMVIPAYVDAVPGVPPPPASKGLDADPARPNGWYPWERRGLGALDFYAAAHLFGLILPGGMVLAELAPRLTDSQLATGTVVGIVSLICAVGVMDATPASLRWELGRLILAAWLTPSLRGMGVLDERGVTRLMTVLALSGSLILFQLAKLTCKSQPRASKLATTKAKTG